MNQKLLLIVVELNNNIQYYMYRDDVYLQDGLVISMCKMVTSKVSGNQQRIGIRVTKYSSFFVAMSSPHQ